MSRLLKSLKVTIRCDAFKYNDNCFVLKRGGLVMISRGPPPLKFSFPVFGVPYLDCRRSAGIKIWVFFFLGKPDLRSQVWGNTQESCLASQQSWWGWELNAGQGSRGITVNWLHYQGQPCVVSLPGTVQSLFSIMCLLYLLPGLEDKWFLLAKYYTIYYIYYTILYISLLYYSIKL